MFLTFNRTSLESKLAISVALLAALDNLLIAPVWNRNCHVYIPFETGAMLLIAPVWNRNADLAKSMIVSQPDLLIAPVWNRNC